MPSKRKRSGPGFNRDDPAAAQRSKKPNYNQVYRLPSRNISGPGIFVTCVQGKERKAALQFIDLLNEVADRLYPGVVPQPQVQAGAEAEEVKKHLADQVETEEDMDALRNGAVTSTIANDQALEVKVEQVEKVDSKKDASPEDDIASQIAAELQDIKASERPSRGTKSKSSNTLVRFKNVETDTECFLFISVSPPFDPYLLVYTILAEVETTGEPRSRFVQRLTPVTTTCSANAEDLTLLSRTILPTYFSTTPSKGTTFKIDPRIRSHSKLKRNDVIQIIASNIPTAEAEQGGERTKIHTANLTSPELWIVVEVVKNSAAISVVKDYERFKKLNLQSVALAANEKKAQEEDKEGQGKGRIGANLMGRRQAKKEEEEEEVKEELKNEEPAQVVQTEESVENKAEAEAPVEEATEKETNDQQMANFRLF
ncbi:related to TAN1 - putative tRNA acetyltransferase [Ustilago trichophora]|uniref:Related to TAN1 - putative tRNA acetyltransferase n=1 Tax=Ustilago trichophora TaxID=86804 RepID=A0A5C3E2T3_9BASI|nr:related to TAN1 - putative tRNA acetyltransferase [Ustilago trichophora]